MRSDEMCSYCLLPRAEAGPLLHSPLATICRRCAESAVGKFQEQEALGPDDPRRLEPQVRQLSDEDLLRRIGDIAGSREQVEGYLAQWVGRARQRGISWARIGGALGMTRQSAWQRFSARVEEDRGAG